MMNNALTAAHTSSSRSVFETSSRKLEQFLFLHDIHHQSWYKDAYNMTVWVYPDNEEVRGVVSEYCRIVERRKARAERAALPKM